MDDLWYLFNSFMILFKHDFTVYGFTFSFLDIFILSCLLAIVGGLIYGLFGGD